MSFNGNRQGHNLYLLDGGENYDRGGGGNSIIMPSIDAIAEMQTLTSNYSAEYGLSSGGTISLVLKSGTCGGMRICLPAVVQRRQENSRRSSVIGVWF